MADLRPALDRLAADWMKIDNDEAIDLSKCIHVHRKKPDEVDLIFADGARVRITDPDQIAGILNRVGL